MPPKKEKEISNIYQLVYNLFTLHLGKTIIALVVIAILTIIVVAGWQVKTEDVLIKKQPILKKDLSPIQQKLKK